MAISLKVNGVVHSVAAEPDTPLLYVLRNDLELNGAKFGCGLEAVRRLHGPARRACRPGHACGPSRTSASRRVTTIEGLGTVDKPHPLQTGVHRRAGGGNADTASTA